MSPPNAGNSINTEETLLMVKVEESIPLAAPKNTPARLMCVGTIVFLALFALGLVNIIDGVNNSKPSQIVVGGVFVACSFACFSSITAMAVKVCSKNKRMQSSQI